MIAFIAVLSVASDGESINFTKDFFFFLFRQFMKSKETFGCLFS